MKNIIIYFLFALLAISLTAQAETIQKRWILNPAALVRVKHTEFDTEYNMNKLIERLDETVGLPLDPMPINIALKNLQPLIVTSNGAYWSIAIQPQRVTGGTSYYHVAVDKLRKK